MELSFAADEVVEQLTHVGQWHSGEHFELLINRTTAKTPGLEVPANCWPADEVIE
jgi:hypothetical protein